MRHTQTVRFRIGPEVSSSALCRSELQKLKKEKQGTAAHEKRVKQEVSKARADKSAAEEALAVLQVRTAATSFGIWPHSGGKSMTCLWIHMARRVVAMLR